MPAQNETRTEPRSARQTFAFGPTYYLRPIELADAQSATIWRPHPYPVPIEGIEEKLREELEVDPFDEKQHQTLLICRRENDQPVGSVLLHNELPHLARILPYANPLAPEQEQDEIIAEVVGFLVPWLLAERNVLSVIVEGVSGRPALGQIIERLGGRLASRLRERFRIHGERRDRMRYQVFHADWLNTLGQPSPPVMGAIGRTVTSPSASENSHPGVDQRSNALAIGERLYLRPFSPTEGALVAQWSLEEQEIHYNEGRDIFNPVSYGHLHRKLAEQDVPTWIRFAIVLRDSDELIGVNGLDNIDWVARTAESETEIFRPQHRNAGLGTEAKHLLLEYGFERLGFHMIYATVDENNPRSQAALRKQGYRDAGYLAWISFAAGSMRGYSTFDLLAAEWRFARDHPGSELPS